MILLAVIFVLIFSSSAFAAVALDTFDTAYADNMDTVSITYTVTGSNTLALCQTAVNGVTDATVTFNGVGMTPVHSESPFSNYYYSLHRMTAVSGTHDFVADTSPDSSFIGLGCVTLTGVDPTTPLGTTVVATGPANVNVTVPAGGMAVDFAGDHPGDCSAALTANAAGQTAIYAECADMTQDVRLTSSYRTTSGDFLWDQYWIQMGVPVNPVAAAVSSNRRAIVVQ